MAHGMLPGVDLMYSYTVMNCSMVLLMLETT